MEFLYAIGLDNTAIAWLIASITGLAVVDYIRATCGRLYRYKDVSGIWIVKDRKTGQEYMESSNGHLTPLTENEKDQ